MLSEEQFNALLELAKQAIRDEVEKQERLWDLADIANYASFSKPTISLFRKRPDFPKAIEIEYVKSGRTQYAKRWEPESIKLWFKRQKAA